MVDLLQEYKDLLTGMYNRRYYEEQLHGICHICAAAMLTEALRAGNCLENLAVLKDQVCADYEQACAQFNPLDKSKSA